MKKKIISIGGGGFEILNRIGEQINAMNCCDLISINTSAWITRASTNIQSIIIGKKNPIDINDGCPRPERGRDAFHFSYNFLENLVKDFDDVIVVACYGGDSGSGITPDFLKLLSKHNVSLRVIILMPLNLGQAITQTANVALEKTKNDVESLHVIYMQDIIRKCSRDMVLPSIFKVAHQQILIVIKTYLIER